LAMEDIERVSILKKDISTTACELTMLILSIFVTFNVTCLTVTSLLFLVNAVIGAGLLLCDINLLLLFYCLMRVVALRHVRQN